MVMCVKFWGFLKLIINSKVLEAGTSFRSSFVDRDIILRLSYLGNVVNNMREIVCDARHFFFN